MVDFGKLLKELRLQNDLTQKQLAQKIGVTKSVVSYYELSERCPSPEVLIKLANIFHTSTDYLLGIAPKEKVLDISDLPNEDIELIQHMLNILRSKNECLYKD